MIDSHAHIYAIEFEKDRDEVIDRAKEAGVQQILMPNIDSTTTDSMNNLAKKYPHICMPMMGLHPCSVKENVQEELKHVEDELSKNKYIAVGEIGTDLYWDKTYWEQQKDAFNYQCELAADHKLPVAIHCRESIDETIELVTPFAKKGLKGVFHCFTGDSEQAKKIIDLGFFIGVGGVSTFKNGGLNKVLPFVEPSRILLETDSPYLAPTPNRGKRNEPSFLNLINKKVAEYLDLSSTELDDMTTKNTIELFNLVPSQERN